MSRPTFLKINLDALQHNLERVQELVPGASVLAMVKANAYGHGIVRVAEALPKADAFGVASLEEGVKLREAGIKQSIILMEGLFHPDELQEAARYQFSLIIHHLPCLEILEKASSDIPPFDIWLKINTGMHRLGFDLDQFNEMHQRLMMIPAVKKPFGLMTHFAEADDVNSDATKHQLDAFKHLTKDFPGPRSLANSAGILGWPLSHADWVRPGLMLYGASPFMDKTGRDHGLQPVMTLESRIIAISEVKKGGRIGYGGTWTADKDIRIGVVGVGYGDGYPQSAKNGTPVLVDGVECPLVGRVSMDMLTVDLSNVPSASIGAVVTLWGDGLPVERVARNSQTTAYEILTRMTPRPKVEVLREFI